MGSTPNALLGQALAYADYGIPVFPVNWRKAPETPNGFKDASTDTKAIQLMFNKAGPKATGIGGYLGGVGMVGFDVDDKPELGKDGHGDLELFEALHGEAIDRDTVTTVTPSGGRHYWYRMGDTPVGSRDGIEYEGRKTAIDIKGGLGYIVLPGSEGYEFLPGFDLFDGTPIATIASWVPQYAPATRAGSGEPGGVIDLSKVDTWIKSHTATTTDPGLDAELDRRCAELAQTSSRHPTLKSNLGWLIGQAGSGIAVDLPAALERLHAAIAENRQRCGEPRDTGNEVADLAAWTVTREANKYAGMVFTPHELEQGTDTEPTEAHQVDEDRPTPAEHIRARVLHGDDIFTIPPKPPLIEGLIDKGDFAVLFGRAGSGKTFTVMDLAGCIATGSWWHGAEVDPGPVFYVIAEGAPGIPNRWKAWKAQNGIHNSVADMHWLPARVNMRSVEWAQGLAEVAAELQPSLIVIDTLSRTFAGGEENGAKDMGAFIDACDLLREATGACVLVVHHTGKDQSQGARGHSSLFGAIDVELEVKNGGDGIITLTSTKQKDKAGNAPPYRFTLTPHGESVAIADYTGTVDTNTLTKTSARVLEALERIAVPEGVSTATWREESVQNGVSRTSFYEARKLLVQQDLVRNLGTSDRGPYVPSTCGSEP